MCIYMHVYACLPKPITFKDGACAETWCKNCFFQNSSG